MVSANLAYIVIEFSFCLKQLGAYLSRVDLIVQQLLILLLDFLNVLLILNLKLVEINELKLISHLLLLCYLISCLHDLGHQRILLIFILLNEAPLLSFLLLKIFLNPLGLDFASSAVFSTE